MIRSLTIFYATLVSFLVGVTVSCEQKRRYSGAHKMYASSSLNIREGPGTDFEILTTVKPNAILLATDSTVNGFVMVLNSDSSKYGWASNQYLRSEPVTLSKRESTADNSETLKFQVTQEITRVGLPYQNRAVMTILVLVDTIPTDQAMKQTATQLWQNGNKGWNEFTVFIELPKEVMDSPYRTYGVFEFNPSGLNQKASSRH